MNRRFFIATLGAAIVSASFALATTFQDSIILDLRTSGYRQISVESTWLGRIRILASKGAEQREIVLNPRTGEVLRDVVRVATASVESHSSRKVSTNTDSNSSGSNGSGTSGSGSGGSETGGSGTSGSGTSGSGTSGSGSSSNDDNEVEEPEKPEPIEREKPKSSEKDDD